LLIATDDALLTGDIVDLEYLSLFKDSPTTLVDILKDTVDGV
jgi:hypothetical protein